MSFATLKVELSLDKPGVSTPTWQDVTDSVTTLTINRGRQYELDQIQAGTCTMTLDNNDRRFDPSYTLGPYYGGLKPMNRIRVSATWSGTTYYLFTGFVERWPPKFSRPQWNEVSITCTDAYLALSQAIITGLFPAALTGARISAVLTAANWATSSAAPGYWTLGTSALGSATRLSYPVPTTVIDVGRTPVPAVTYTATQQQTALAHIQDIAVNSERGIFFIDGQGRAVFHDRVHRLGLVTSSVTLSDSQSASTSSSIRYADIAPSMDADHVVNDVTVTASAVGASAQEAMDSTSIDTYFRRSLSVTPQLNTDAEALNMALFILRQTKVASERFDSVTLEPWTDDNIWPHALGREISDRVSVSLTPPSTSDVAAQTISQECHIEAVQHTITPPLLWETVYQLSPRPPEYWVLGTSQLGSTTVPAF
jgi:hypothetical protein